MKAVKIILVAIVIGAIGFFVFKWTTDSGSGKGDGKSDLKVTYPSIPRVEKDIDSLQALSNKEFNRYLVERNILFKSKNLFKGIQGDIDDYHSSNSLGESTTQNEQEYKNLSKTLFSAYVPKFVDEVYYKFENSRWKEADLVFIKSEIKEIESNPFFDRESSTYNSTFDEMNTIISTYHGLVSFNVQMKRFPSVSDYSVNGRFPIDDVEEKIAESKTHLRTCVNTQYINNLTWLKNEFKKIPHQMYQKNFDFLKEQIRRNSGEYKNLASQPDYSRGIYQPLKRNIKESEYSIYGVDDSKLRNDKRRLMKKLNKDNDKASRYFQEKW